MTQYLKQHSLKKRLFYATVLPVLTYSFGLLLSLLLRIIDPIEFDGWIPIGYILSATTLVLVSYLQMLFFSQQFNIAIMMGDIRKKYLITSMLLMLLQNYVSYGVARVLFELERVLTCLIIPEGMEFILNYFNNLLFVCPFILMYTALICFFEVILGRLGAVGKALACGAFGYIYLILAVFKVVSKIENSFTVTVKSWVVTFRNLPNPILNLILAFIILLLFVGYYKIGVKQEVN